MKQFLPGILSRSARSRNGAGLCRRHGCQGTATRAALAPINDWTGFIMGENWAGWVNTGIGWDFLDVTGFAVASGCRERSGGLIGGQIGYRWQANQWVFGVEAQGDWADFSNQRVSLVNPAFSTRTKTDGIGLFIRQIGYAWNAALFYVKGGAAVTSNRFSILENVFRH